MNFGFLNKKCLTYWTLTVQWFVARWIHKQFWSTIKLKCTHSAGINRDTGLCFLASFSRKDRMWPMRRVLCLDRLQTAAFSKRSELLEAYLCEESVPMYKSWPFWLTEAALMDPCSPLAYQAVRWGCDPSSFSLYYMLPSSSCLGHPSKGFLLPRSSC